MANSAKLIQQARLARDRARAAFSGYPVGAAVQTLAGKIFLGCNVESSAFPTTICAERVAIFNAITAGEDTFTALAVVTEDGNRPCGACRQVILEQCGNIEIYLAKPDGSQAEVFTSTELLPHPFTWNG